MLNSLNLTQQFKTLILQGKDAIDVARTLLGSDFDFDAVFYNLDIEPRELQEFGQNLGRVVQKMLETGD